MQHLETPRLVVAEIGTIGDDDVILKLDAHDTAGLANAFCQVVVGRTGTQAARRVIMADGEDGGVAQHGLADDDTDIDCNL